MTKIIGIDLGTTNSLVSVFRDGEAEIIPNALGEALTPSVVGLDDGGELLVGRAARERLVTHPDLTAAAFKRYMGTSREIALGHQVFRPEELSALVLKSLKADAEAFLGHEVKEAIITVPAYFSDAQRKATRVADELADLKIERLLNEPTAAALAYGLQELGADHTFLVFDLGGGTFDVSLLELFDDVMEVRASAGDNFLGGEDFTHRIMDGFVHEHANPELLDDSSLRGLLHASATRAMHELTAAKRTTVSIPFQGERLEWAIDEAMFHKLCEPLLDKLRTPIERALRDARVKVEVDVYQGESPKASDNIRLGELLISVPLKPAGEASIDVRFTYDINGLLEVETNVVGTSETRRLVIVDNPGVLSREEIDARFKALAALKIHPRDRDENRALMAQAERLYEEHLGYAREVLGVLSATTYILRGMASGVCFAPIAWLGEAVHWVLRVPAQHDPDNELPDFNQGLVWLVILSGFAGLVYNEANAYKPILLIALWIFCTEAFMVYARSDQVTGR